MRPAHIAPVVLVEDNPDDVVFVRQALEGARIHNPLIVFEDAERAREYLTQPRAPRGPVLLVLDLQLSGNETGLDLLAWLREQPAPLGATPALILTGSERPDDREESYRLGAIVFLQKPVTDDNFIVAVQSLGLVAVSNLTSGQLGFRITEKR